MNLQSYQRTILAYHGCETDVAEKILDGLDFVRGSANAYDWLGQGAYFWEHGPDRAIEWAQRQKKNGKIAKPAVVGAVVKLGMCFDLLDSAQGNQLANEYPNFVRHWKGRKRSNLPANVAAGPWDYHKRHRFLDCAMIQFVVDRINRRSSQPIQTVRGVFVEGDPAYPGACVHPKSSIQIAVRDPRVIVGYFRPFDHSGNHASVMA